MSPAERVLPGRTFPIIFAAPSGAGKTTIAQMLKERRGDMVFSVSATTRAPRQYERDGEHYHFVSETEFRRMVDRGELVEWAQVHGNFYGTPRRNVVEATEKGLFLVLDIDIQGARQIRNTVPEAVSIFILPPSGTELATRLAGRGSDEETVRRRRLANACGEIQAATEFDYVVVNRDLETAVGTVEAILVAESHRVERLDLLDQEVTRLCTEITDCLRGDPPALSSLSDSQEER